ncbi:hypothetical protein GQX73_g2859 [Xylaria multiplex]|uniref:Heterokaryon incompatibility domain-containing protein n=1 Tax=Xylaria multiplex TaxID=323545 RepID=A0A7C8ITL4_9PEZI|nr:hypothetical protein GQX73_g2859 [Xylaria multiplex]
MDPNETEDLPASLANYPQQHLQSQPPQTHQLQNHPQLSAAQQSTFPRQYTTVGSVYNPQPQPLQPPIRRGRTVKSLFPYKSESPAGPPQMQYTPLQQNSDRAVSPARLDSHSLGLTLPINRQERQVWQRFGVAVPSVQPQAQTIADSLQSPCSTMFFNTSTADSDSDSDGDGPDTKQISGMNFNSLTNLASYRNPMQRAARRVLASHRPNPVPSTGVQIPDGQLTHYNNSETEPLPSLSGASMYTSTLSKVRGAPAPLTAGPPGVRQLRSTTFEQDTLQRARDFDDENPMLNPYHTRLPFGQHTSGPSFEGENSSSVPLMDITRDGFEDEDEEDRDYLYCNDNAMIVDTISAEEARIFYPDGLPLNFNPQTQRISRNWESERLVELKYSADPFSMQNGKEFWAERPRRIDSSFYSGANVYYKRVFDMAILEYKQRSVAHIVGRPFNEPPTNGGRVANRHLEVRDASLMPTSQQFVDPEHHDTKDHLDEPLHFTVSLSRQKNTYLSLYQVRSLKYDEISSFDHNQILGQLGLVHRFGDELDDTEISTQFLSDLFGPDTTLDSILFRDLDVNTGSKHTLRIAANWLARCQTQHALCSASLESHPKILPSRVIDVTPAKPRVIETGGVEGRWVALSYCWGSDTSFMLNETTRAQLFAGFQPDAAPATIHDAILVTRELGIPYLWVDALCIRQDSREDWEKEAPRMKHVYAQAELVVAAADAVDVGAGMLQEREIDTMIPIPWIATNDESQRDREQYVYARRSSPNINTGDTSESRWRGRGWTMQEAFLAGRLLTFNDGGLTWQCQQLTEEEDGSYVMNIPDVDRDEWMHRPSALFMSKYWRHLMTASAIKSSNGDKASVSSPRIPDGMYTDPYSMWYVTLAHYSSRYLTHASDRLHALSGLADLFHEITGDEYVVGLWKGDLLRGLIWTYHPSRIQEGIDRFTTDEVDPWDPLTTTNLGPSWSWTSLEGRIYEPEDGYRGHFERVPGNRARVLGIEAKRLTVQAPFVAWSMEALNSAEGGQSTEADHFTTTIRDYVVGIMNDGSGSDWDWDFSTRFSAEYNLRRGQAQGGGGQRIAVVFVHPDGTALILESTPTTDPQPQSSEKQSLNSDTYRRLGVLQFGVDIVPPLTADEQEPRKRRGHDFREAQLTAHEAWYQGLPLDTFVVI